MIDLKTSLAIVVVLAASVSLAGCASEVGSPEPTQEEPQPPPAPTFSAEGLELETSGPDRVAGRLVRDGTAIRFDLSRDRALDSRHVVLESASGEALFESTLQGGIDVSSYLGGRVKTTGAVGEEPRKEGDVTAFEALSARPEAKLMPQLKETLGAAGVAEDLYRVASPTADAPISPRVYGAGGNTPYPDNVWRILGTGQSVGFYSWGFWSTTVVVMEGAGADRYGTAVIRVGPYNATEYVSGYGEQRHYRQWWGAYATVTNIRAPLCSVSFPYYCQNIALWVLIK